MKNKLITDRNLNFKNTEVLGAISQFYNDEENIMRNRHTVEYHNSYLLFNKIEPRIDALTQLVSPYPSEEESANLAEYLPDLKSSLASYIGLTKASIVMSDNYSFELRPQDDDEKVVDKIKKLNAVILTEMAKARSNNFIRDALRTSRMNLFGATLITWKNPKDLGGSDNISLSPLELKNINPKNLRWDPNYTRIEDMSYAYVLSKITWFDIVEHPILGKKKDLLTYLQNQINTGQGGEVSGFSDLQTRTSIENNINKADAGYDSMISSSLVLKTRFWLKNKGRNNQKCMVSYYIGDNILLATQDTNCKIIPISVVYEEKQAGDFYGSCAVHRLAPRIQNFNNTLRKLYADAASKGATIYFISKDAQVDIDELAVKALNEPVVFQKIDTLASQSILKVDPSSIDQTILGFLRDEKEDILSMAGIGRITSEADSGSLRSDRGVSTVQEQSRIIDEASYTYIRDYMARVYTIAMEYIIKKYDTLNNDQKMKVRVDRQDPSTYEVDGTNYEFIEVAKGDFTDLYYKADIIPDFTINPQVNKTALKNLLLEILAIDRQAANPETQILANKPELVKQFLMPFLNTPGIHASFARQSIENHSNVLEGIGRAGMETAINNPNKDVGQIFRGLGPTARKGLAGDMEAEMPMDEGAELGQEEMEAEMPPLGGLGEVPQQ